MKACIIIPTYNEKENIKPLIDELEKMFLKVSDWNVKILVVDDRSPDGTGDIVKKLQHHYSNIFLISGEKKGLGEAYKRGFQYVLDHIETDYVVQMDADFQHKPKDILRLFDKAVAGYEFIIGSRYIDTSDYSSWSLKRKIFSHGANFIARRIAGIQNVNDCTSGFRCISTKFLKSFDLKVLRSSGYAFQMSMLHIASTKKASILEIPIHFPGRAKGTSKLRFKDIVEFFFDALKLRGKKY